MEGPENVSYQEPPKAASPDLDLERLLFEIPDYVEFPLELNQHLKGKLHSVLQQNWHLKRHLDYLDKEVIELRKYRSEHREKCGREHEPEHPGSTTSIMSQRIVELSKKNRDMTSQTETMKTKINKLMRENDSLRNMVECFKGQDASEDLESRSCSQLDFELSPSTPGSQQNAQLTNKVIEYRRQNQLLRMELKTALRALSQEVGDGATPHGVLNVVTGNGMPAWRGRQQQIIALQQRVSDLHLKLRHAISTCNAADLEASTNGGGDADPVLGEGVAQAPMSLSASLALIPQRAALIQQDKKKQEQIEKLTQDLEQTTKECKSAQQELKACKARIQTLEINVKTHKSHSEILEEKLLESERQSLLHSNEMKLLRQELQSQKDRERKYRDQAAIEIQDGQRTLQRERSIVTRLQSIIQEKQDAIHRLDVELVEIRNKLEISCAGKIAGGIDTVDRIRQMETQLEKASKAMEAGDRERQSLLKMMQDYLNQAEDERKKFIHASEYTARITCVLERSNECINECLEAGQITSKDILQEVEHIRTLMRELKLSDLYVYENVRHTDMSSKLKTQVDMLKREVTSLKTGLKEISVIRRKDLENFASVTERLKCDWEDIIQLKQRSVPGTPYNK